MAAAVSCGQPEELHSSLGRLASNNHTSAERQHRVEASAWFSKRWLLVRLDTDEIPGLVRQWLINRGRERFENGSRA